MNQEQLVRLGFGRNLLDDEKKILLGYAAWLMERLANGELGETPDDNVSLNFFNEIEAYNPQPSELRKILAQIQSRKAVEVSIVPAMLAAVPTDVPIEKTEYESIKAWVLLACISIAQVQGQVSIVVNAARRVRLMLKPNYDWMIKALPSFRTNIHAIVDNLEDLREQYKNDEDDRKKRNLYVSHLHTLLKDYQISKFPEIREPKTTKKKARVLQSLKIPPTTGMTLPDLNYKELVELPKKDILSINKKEIVADQLVNQKYLQLTVKRKQVERDLAIRTRQAMAMANHMSMREMRFASDWGTLTFHEAKTALKVTWERALKDDYASLIVVLMLLTGRNFQRLYSWLVKKRDFNDSYRLHDGWMIFSYSPALPLHSLRGEGSRLIRAVDEHCLFLLPKELLQPIKRLQRKIKKNRYDISVNVDTLIKKINKEFNIRLTAERISGDLFSRLRAKGVDLAEAAVICGHAPEQCPPMFYYSVQVEKLSEIYKDVISDYYKFAGLKINIDSGEQFAGEVGSRLQIESKYIKSLFQILFERVNCHKVNTTNELFDYHNELTVYTYLILSLTTCHRPVTRPFEFRTDIDLCRKLIWISDKEVRSGLSARIIGLCDVACEQIKKYDQHLKWLEKQLRFENIEHFNQVTEAIQGESTYLFILSPRKLKPLNPIILHEIMKKSWPVPLNWQRHFMRSELIKSGLNGDEVNAFMGHARFGEEAFGPWSGMGMGVLKKIASKVDEIFEQLNIKPVSSQHE